MHIHDLAALPLFASLDHKTLADITRWARHRSFRAGQYIMYEGEQAPGLFIVMKGRVRLSCTAPDGREQVLDMIGPGENVHLASMFDGQPNPVNARAMSPVESILLPREDFLMLLRAHPDLAMATLHEMAGHLRELVRLVEDLAFRSVRARLARQLLAEAAEGTAEITHQELAERAGTVREMAGRVLRQLAEAGLVRMERGRVIVLDAHGLAEVIEE